MYNSDCHAEQDTRALCFSTAARVSQSNIVGKVPSINGFRPVLAVPRDNGSATCEGHFAMDMSGFGIYALIFYTDEGEKFYIGSTSENFHKRILRHLQAFRRNQHPNKHMQYLWNKYGCPDIKIIEQLNEKNNIIHREQFWIDQVDKSICLNMGPAYPCPVEGRKHSPEEREKISKALIGHPGNHSMLGRKHSAETKDKMSSSHKGPNNSMYGLHHSEETKIKQSKAAKTRIRKPHSQITRQKIPDSNLGRKMSPKAKIGLLESHLGISVTDDTRRKISEGMKNRWKDPEYREKKATKYSTGRNKDLLKKEIEETNG